MRKRFWSCSCGECLICDHRRQKKLDAKRVYRLRYPERVRQQQRAAMAKRPAHYSAKTAQWQAENREKSNAIKRAWSERHPEKQKEIERRKNARNNRKRKGVPLDGVAVEYAEILRFDPCVYCRGGGGELDHIVPVNDGGKSNWENLAAACKSCNSAKHTRSLLGFLTYRLDRKEAA